MAMNLKFTRDWTFNIRNDAGVEIVEILSLRPGRRWTVDPLDHLNGTA